MLILEEVIGVQYPMKHLNLGTSWNK